MNRISRRRNAAILLLITALSSRVLAGEAPTGPRGITDSEVLVGECAALSGPAAGLGTGMSSGLKLAFDELNAKGGVNGRKIRLQAEDDAYEPEKCADCTAKMIEETSVFALAGYVGTPTAKVAAPMAQEAKLPLVGIFSGATLLRDPVQRYIINVRASYDNETDALVAYLLETGAKKIAVFYQNDAFGLSGLSGTQKALDQRHVPLAGKGSFERNTLAVKAGLASLMDAAPDAIVIVAPYKPTAEFVRAAREAGLKSRFAAISFVGTENLLAELGPAADGILVSQVVPSPTDPVLQITKDYQAALGKFAPALRPSYVSFEGYITGRVFIAGLDKAGKAVTRDSLADAFNGLSKLDLGGFSISFSETNHQGSNTIFLTELKSGAARVIR